MKRIVALILTFVLMVTIIPINTINVFAEEATKTVVESEEIIDIENMETIDEVGLTISQETLPVFLEYYPEYFFDNETYEKLLSDSYYSCAEAITSYSTLETGGLAILESIANGEKIIFKSIANTLFGTQTIEDEWTEKNVTNLMQELCSMDTIIKDSWKKTNDTFKVFKTVIDAGTNITKVVECVKKCDDSLSNEAIEKILKEAIKREFDRVPDDLKVMDWIEPVMSTFVGAWFLCQVEETIVEELLSEINQDSSLYEALSALKADMEGNQEKYIVKKIADATLYKAVKDLMKETFEVVYDGISKTYKFLPKLSFMKVQSSTIKTAISIFYNYLYQGAKISELHGAIQTQDFLNTIQSVYLNKKTELMRNAINGTLTDDIINEFVFYFNAHRCARIQYISACAEIAKTDELKETLNNQLAEIKKYTIEEYLVLCNNSIPGIDKFIYRTEYTTYRPIIYGYNGEETHIEFPACLNGRVVKEIGSNYIANYGEYVIEYPAIESVVVPDTVEKIGEHAFKGIESLNSVILGKNVTNIHAYAFYKCSNLESVSFDENIKNIYYSAFSYCTSLSSVEILSDVDIGEKAFWECDSLTTVYIPNCITIGKSAFDNCDSLITVDISNCVTISNYAFAYCKNLSNITWSEKLISIGNNAFCGCAFKEINIPTNVDTIGSDAFFNCDSLTSVNIPGSVKNIGYSAFSDCDNLKTVIIDEGVPYIGNRMFHSNDNLVSVSLPNTISYIDEMAFSYCPKIESITIPGSVESIGNQAFYTCTNLTSVTFNDGLTSIGKEAFSHCPNLSEFVLPQTLTRIDYRAFAGCAIETIVIPKSITYMYNSFCSCDNLTSVVYEEGTALTGNGTFEYCSNLKSVVISDSVKVINTYTFYECSNLKEIKLPKNLTSIEIGAFMNSGLTSIEIPESVTFIGDKAFKETDLLSVNIPKGITAINDEVFYACNFTSIELPDSVTSIGDYAFYNCGALSSIDIPNSVTSIGDYAFAVGMYYANSLSEVILPDSIVVMGTHVFERRYNLISVKLPKNITFISASTFSICEKLQSIVIPESVTTIHDHAFQNCYKLTSITIPNSVTNIDAYAFVHSGITDVYYGGTETQKESMTISSLYNDSLINATWHYNCIPISYNGKEENVQWDDENKPILPKGYTDEQNKHFAIIGWTDKDGNKVDTSTLTVDNMIPLTAVVAEIPVAPTMLEADLIPTNDPYLPTGNKYINGFYVQGTQIRVPSDDENIKMGLRFVNVLDNNLLSALKEGATDISYGTLVMLKKYHNGGEVTLDTQTAKKVEGKNTFKYASEFNNQYLKYTVAVTGITEEYFTEKFIVRPYISFTYNGNTVTLYGEQYEDASLYSAAKLAVAPDSIEEQSVQTWIQENIVAVVEKPGDNDVPSDDVFA